ncbi:MAG: triose-phosphate isomerase [Ottowia sp.]
MTRRKLVAGNWKMTGSLAANRALAAEVLERLPGHLPCDVVICPPPVHVAAVAEVLQGQAQLLLGAQDVAAEADGAYTGDVSGAMLRELGVRYCIVGHSERRQHQHESNLAVAQKTQRALDAGLTPIVCLGETAQQRDAGWTDWVLGHQLDAVARALGQRLAEVVLAYEPVWAIGTGQTASPAQAQQVHAALREQMAQRGVAAERVRIVYGGSMNPANAADLLAQPDIDGGLVGGAARVADDFVDIVEAAGRSAMPGAGAMGKLE